MKNLKEQATLSTIMQEEMDPIYSPVRERVLMHEVDGKYWPTCLWTENNLCSVHIRNNTPKIDQKSKKDIMQLNR